MMGEVAMVFVTVITVTVLAIIVTEKATGKGKFFNKKPLYVRWNSLVRNVQNLWCLSWANLPRVKHATNQTRL